MPTPPASSATVNLTTSGSFGSTGDAVFSTSLLQPAGSGTFGTFVQIQGGDTEQGYNTDFRPQQFDEKNSAPHNHALLLASVPIVEGDGTNGTIDGLLYREFVLDINEPNGQSRNFLSLDALQIFQAEVGNLTGFHQPLQQGGDGDGFGVNATLRYDLDAGGDSWIALNDGVGSGGADARVLIPNSFFDENTPYVILYSAFGYQDASWAAQGGFEEWGTRGPQGNVPALNIAMTESVPGDTANVAGEVITYAITVRNMGNVSLTGVTVSDPFVSDLTRGLDVVGNNDNTLNVGEIWSYSAHHTVTQAELNSASDPDAAIVNTATADSDQTGPDSVSVTTPLESATQLAIVKESDVEDASGDPDADEVDEAGHVINYTITITNTGSTALTNPVVTDLVPVPVPDLAAPIENPNAGTFFSVLNGDFNLGDTNENGVQDLGETFQYVYPGDISMDGIHDPGETWVAFNLGDLDHDGFHDVGETWVGDTNQNGIEEAGERWQFQNVGDANHNNFQDSGEVWEYANVGDSNLNGVEDPGETFVLRNVGDANQNGIEDPGETFEYYNAGDTNQNGEEDPGETFQFTTVPQALPGIDADSNGVNDGDTDGDGIVDPGETWLYQGPTHTVTQEEIDNGGIVDPGLSIDNTASASTDQTAPVDATASVQVEQDPDVTLLVAGTLNDGINDRPDAGETISYAFTVTNSGNMTLHDIAVSDPVVTVNGTTIVSLAPGASDGTSFTGSYTITQADIDAGFFDNTSTADASAGAPGGFAVEHDDDEHVVLLQDPSLVVAMTAALPAADADGFIDSPDDNITYTITVTNDGNVTLHDVVVTDTLSGLLSGPASGDIDADGDLDVNETWTYTTTYDVLQSDIDNGGVVDPGLSIDNTVEVVTDRTGPDSASASVDIAQAPSVTLENFAVEVTPGTFYDDINDNGRPDAGETISYEFTVTNNGNMTLFDIDVTDPVVDVTGSPIASLAPGASNNTAFTGSYEIEQADIDTGSFANTSTAEATAGVSGGSFLVDDTDDETVTLPQVAAMTLEKIGVWLDTNGNEVADVGDTIHFTFRVENIGNITLHDVGVTDLNGDVTMSGTVIPSLAPGAVDDTTWSGTHPVAAVDLPNGYTNTAAANANEGGNTSDTEHVDPPESFGSAAMAAMVESEPMNKWGLPGGTSSMGATMESGPVDKWDYLFN